MSSEQANTDTDPSIRNTAYPVSSMVDKSSIMAHQLVTRLQSSMRPFHGSREIECHNLSDKPVMHNQNTVDIDSRLTSSSVTINVQSGAVTSTEPAVPAVCDVDIEQLSSNACGTYVNVHSNVKVHSAGDLLCETITTVDSTTIDGDDTVLVGIQSHQVGPCTPPDIPCENSCEKEDGEISDDEPNSGLMESSVDCSEISSTNSSSFKPRQSRIENSSIQGYRSMQNFRGRTFKPLGYKGQGHKTSEWDSSKKTDLAKNDSKNLAVKRDALSSQSSWNHIGSPISSNSDSDVDIDRKIEEAISKNQKLNLVMKYDNEQEYEHVERSRTRSLSSDVESLISSSESCCKEDSYLASEEASIPAGKRKV